MLLRDWQQQATPTMFNRRNPGCISENLQEAYVGLRFKIIILFAYINSKQASLLLSSYGRSSEPTKKGTKSWSAIRRHKTVIECQLGHRGDNSADTSM